MAYEPCEGVYRHYKGALYRVLHVAQHSDSQEKLVVYEALYGQGKVWARPLDAFSESVIIDGRAVCRFEYLHANAGAVIGLKIAGKEVDVT